MLFGSIFDFTLNEDKLSWAVKIKLNKRNVEMINIPAKHKGKPVTVIDTEGFRFCENLIFVGIPEGIKEIRDGAFACCFGLEKIKISKTVEKIGTGAFDTCDKLTEIVVDDENQSYKAIDNNLYSKDGEVLVKYASGKPDKEFLVPYDVKTIGERAFHFSKSLEKVVMKSSVEKIGAFAFGYCETLKSVKIPPNVREIEDSTFLNCTGMDSVIIPAGVKEISSSAFREIKEITIILSEDSDLTYTADRWNTEEHPIIVHIERRKQIN